MNGMITLTYHSILNGMIGSDPPFDTTFMNGEMQTRYGGHGENVTAFDTQRDLTARQGAHTRCHCTQGKALGQYHSREAHRRYLSPRDMAINEHQLAESSIADSLRAGAHALFVLL